MSAAGRSAGSSSAQDRTPEREPERAPDGSPLYSVSALTDEMRGVLGVTFGEVWVRGEISQPRRPASGHVYLTLKDDDAVLPAVLWRSTAARLRFQPEDGQEVLVCGGIDVYPPHGRYQLIIRRMEPLGDGALRLAFEQMRRRLEAEGLFDDAAKKPLPFLPRRIALVTSRTGAAVRDMVTVILRRLPSVSIVLLSTRVQGAGAAEEIAAALGRADRLAGADVIIVGRGGGSLEDLWAFNEEIVARAIAAAHTPVVSAVGHETDTTIADLVADVRAATPSQAGELVVPSQDALLDSLRGEQERLVHRMRVRLERAWQRVEALGDRPVLRNAAALLAPRRRVVEQMGERLRANMPAARLRRRRSDVGALGRRLTHAQARRCERVRARTEGLAGRLEALSPLAVLRRGYAITRHLDEGGTEGAIVRTPADVAAGQRLRTRTLGAVIDSRVEAVEDAPREPSSGDVASRGHEGREDA